MKSRDKGWPNVGAIRVFLRNLHRGVFQLAHAWFYKLRRSFADLI